MIFLAFFSLLTWMPLFAQETLDDGQFSESSPDLQQDYAVPPEETVYFIQKIDFTINGRTRPFALMDKVDLEIGERLHGQRALETYIRRRTQVLRNQRVLEADQSRIEYIIGEAGADGLVPVDLTVYTADTWNFIVLPEPKYDSNTGLSLTLKARDYNFLGTMSPLAVNLGYKLEDNKNSVFLDIDSDTPFQLFGYTWNLNFDNSFIYTENDPFYYKNTTGISLELPSWAKSTFTFGLNQSFILNEETSDDEKHRIGTSEEFFPDVWFMSSEAYVQWKIPTGVEVGDFGDLSYTPKITEKINYRPGGDIGEYRRGPATIFSHSFGFGQTNWKGNYRSGIDVKLENENEFNNYSLKWDNDLKFTAIGHFKISSFFGISSRFQYRQYFNNPNIEAGDVLRGMMDDSLHADAMLSLNMEFPLRVLQFLPSQWFGYRALRPFNFELHFAPFIDLALLRGEDTHGETYSFKEIIPTGGFEFIAYPLSWRSFYIRGSLGWNLQKLIQNKKLPSGDFREIYIGVGHFY
ncbi:hypothetical protein LQZ19_14550 [Treponema primitia]|uniref:hypothetical protein n=1 Tax=Treponema primitia TaxID=88058 RepID=UPI0039817AB5